MTLKNAFVWSQFSYGYRIGNPSGWLLSPGGRKLIHFESCNNSSRRNLKINLKTFYADHSGQPRGIKSANKISINDAWQKWHDLLLKGWTLEIPNL